MTQTQEEMVLICAFGLFWVGESSLKSSPQQALMKEPAALIAWRAFSHSEVDLGRVVGVDTPIASASREEPGTRITGGIRPYPCSSDDLYCVVEEYTFW